MIEIGAVIGCPHCQSPLEAGNAGTWRCTACGRRFGQEGEVPVLLREEDHARFAAFNRRYRADRRAEGWQPLTTAQALSLPYGRAAGYPALYWPVRRESFCALMALLAREGPAPAHGPIADLGAGSCWLSYRLAHLGYDALAVDTSLDPDLGLGAAARHYLPHVHFARAQGDLAHPPLQPGQLALTILNASLHYAVDLEAALGRIARALRPGGRLVVLDTPIARRPRPGTGRGDRHLGREELNEALRHAGLTPRWIPVRRGAAWWRHQTRAWLRRAPRFSFPLVVADRST
jgi:SAM-dependent methyltransferase